MCVPRHVSLDRRWTRAGQPYCILLGKAIVVSTVSAVSSRIVLSIVVISTVY